MNIPIILAKVRDQVPLQKQEIIEFTTGLADGSVSDAQATAFAMAVCLNGLSERERVDLTLAMRDTGNVRNWDLPCPVIDKHSTGGIGDNVSLVLAPMLASCGAYVPMVSGRGLGHTGGTLDKLESIPGYRTQVSGEEFECVVSDVGCAIVGAGEGIAPADKRLYAIRDLTGTVESVDLITSSILSKKLAAGWRLWCWTLKGEWCLHAGYGRGSGTCPFTGLCGQWRRLSNFRPAYGYEPIPRFLGG